MCFNGFVDGIICCNEKKQVDIDALNLLSSGALEELCQCKYKNEMKHHCFIYDTQSISPLQPVVAFDDTLNVLRAAARLIRHAREHQLALDNIKSSKECFFESVNGYKFIYIPLICKHKLTGKSFLLKVLRAVRCKDPRVLSFLKDIKRTDNDDQALDRLDFFLMQNSAGSFSNPERLPETETETSILGEGETTLLGMQDQTPHIVAENNFLPEQQEETTLLNRNVGANDTEADALYGVLGETAFIEDESSEYETTVLTPQSAADPPEPAGGNASDYHLILIRSSNGERIPVDITPFSIGKDDANVDCVIHNDSVSRYHAKIIFDHGNYYIVDNNSTNGTVIEGIKLQPYERAEIENGSIITLGNESLQARIESR